MNDSEESAADRQTTDEQPKRTEDAMTVALAPAFINDAGSFAAVADDDRQLAALYAYANLDCLVDLAKLVAHDFFVRPQLYTDISDSEVLTELARLESRSGSHEYYLAPAQRRALFTPLFGDPEAGGDFVRLREPFLEAASAFAQWSQASGIPMLRERVRTTHRPLREFLLGLRGSSVNWSRQVIGGLAERVAYPILRERGVIAVFGLNQPPGPAWPYREDANGDKVVEQIAGQLDTGAAQPLTRESFGVRQRIALRGAEALAAVLQFREEDGDEQLDALITRAYTWHATLKAARPKTDGDRAGNGTRT
ncbi:hypothetical protein [Streptomyces sp. NBC_01465]|uniref:hypothetical protein n=1 Tax=Streptomyces sp. NBC_01465 TaxID=2903878 RepID=UPI002E311B37|nr:hypothetical protein [Streptomyces sp. NBC_01465]